jgi:DNA polymerase-3 subunit beta
MKRFISIIKELPSVDITVELTKNNLLIKCEKIEFKINTLDVEEFPKIEEEKKTTLIKLNPDVLEEMIRITSFCAGHEENNYVLNGILFELEEDIIKLAATDGKRLAFAKKNLPANQPEIKTKISFILPIKAINELYKLIKEKENEIFLFIDENRVGFDFKDTQFIARPIEGEFPNYAQYIPGESKEKLSVNREAFLTALRRADLLSTPDYLGVKMELKKDNLVISKMTPQLGEARETMEAEYSGAPLQIGFNPAYLTDALKNLIEEKVAIEFFGPDKPAVMRKEGYVYLLLPMKT